MLQRWIGLVLMAVSFLSLGLVLYIALQRRTKGSRELAVMMTAAAIYAFGYAMELQSADVKSMLSWIRIEYLGIPFIPYFWLLFAWSFSSPRPLSRPVVAAP